MCRTSIVGPTPGWNEYVKDAHSETRDAFKLWVLSSKPRHGDVFQSMKQSRARFKFKLSQCTRDEARIRVDILANDLVKRNTTLFWSHVSKTNRRCIIHADTDGGATGRDAIAFMWKNHYANLFNCVDNLFNCIRQIICFRYYQSCSKCSRYVILGRC